MWLSCRMTRALLRSVPILLLSAALSGGPAAGGARAQDAAGLQGALADLLENEPRLALPVRQRKAALSAYYLDNGGRPLWIGTGLMPQLIAEMRGATAHGLLASDYPADRLEKLAQVAARTDLRSQAVIELLYSASFLKFASDIKSGRFLPKQIDKELYWGTKDVDLAVALARLAATGALAKFLHEWEPGIPEYRALKSTLTRYRALAANGGWPKLPSGEVLKPGNEDDRVPVLRARLAATDGAAAEAPVESANVYDEGLVEALKHFQRRHGLEPDGVLGKRTLFQLNVTAEERIRQIIANLERWRWMPEKLGQHYVIVNIAGFELKRVRNDRIEERMRVVVGKPYHRTPVFSDEIKYLEINPYWNVPRSIAVKEYLPQLRSNPASFAARGFEAVSGDRVIDVRAIDWGAYSASHFPVRLRQRPGPRNALGRVKFMFPNRFNVYLHDTPARALFGRAERAFSHGCIRLARPIDLADQVLADVPGWNRRRIDQVLDDKARTVVKLERHLPVHLTYATAWRGEGGTVHFAADIYQRDRALHRALFGRPTPS